MATSNAAAKVIRKFRLENIPISRIKAASTISPGNASPASQLQPLTARNPFLPQRTVNGRWGDPKLSLRRQADLVKKAKAGGLLHLLPPGPKNPNPTPYPHTFANSVLKSVSSSVQRDALRTPHNAEVSSTREAAPKPEAQTAELVSVAEPSHTVALYSSQDKTPLPERLLWQHPIIWTGNFKPKVVPGAELGTRLYANKKRMFKGHKWERVKSEVERKRTILMRDMKKRLAGYKSVRLSFIILCRTINANNFCVVLQEEKAEPAQTFEVCKGRQITVLTYSFVTLL